MADVGIDSVRLVDKDGDSLDDGNGRLNINATLEAASVNVGDVDILSVPAPLNVTGGGTESSALRVTIADDSTGVLTVDGTVTANLSATDNAVLDTISLNTLTMSGATKLEDSAHSSGDRGMHVLTVRKDAPQSNVNTDGDYASLSTDYTGGLYTRELSNYILDTFTMIVVDNASEQLSDTIGVFVDVHEVMLQADEANSGYVIVGDADVADNRGMKLNPGDTIILNTHDTRGVYLWGSAAGQNVRCMLKRRPT